MNIGWLMTTYGSTPDELGAIAVAVEEAGFAELWVGEHVATFDAYRSRYPYSADGTVAIPGVLPWLGQFELLTFVAARTRRIRIGTAICLAAQRNPVYTAKSVATLDWLSGGRVDFGVAAGWSSEEFDAVMVAFEHRGARLREYLRIMRSLWSEPVTTFDGQFYRLDGVRQYPKPLQQPHPPVYLGGETDIAVRRAAQIGDGWIGFGHTPESARARIQQLHVEMAAVGRDPAEARVVVGVMFTEDELQRLDDWKDIGVDQLMIFVSSRNAEEALRGVEVASRMPARAASL